MTRAKFLAVVNSHGATVDEISEENGTLDIDTPAGKVWASCGTHNICVPFTNNGGQSWKADAYAEAVERMSMGLEDCEDLDCDSCHDNREE